MCKTSRNVRLALALLLACAPCALAQKRGAAPPPPQSKAAARAAREAERSRRKAVAVLLEVAGDAKALEDHAQRATVLTLAASALWGADEQAARATFERAWQAAVEADEAEFKKEQDGGRYGDLPERFTGMREAVLAAAAQHDPRMADAWLGALADWLSRRRGEEETAAGGADIGPADEFTRDGQRLTLASTLADDGAYAEAARVAAPAFQKGVSGALVEFLLRLRAGAPEEADRLYLQLLASARARKEAGGNDVLILSSYVLTPRLLAAVNADGSVGFRPIGEAPDTSAGVATATPTASQRTREVFFDSAAAILLRASLNAGTTGDMSALYFAIGRLLPYFEREGSAAHAAALQAKFLSLASQIGLERRAALESKLETQDLSPRNPTDPLRRLLEQAEGAGDAKLRDEARLKVVAAAAKRELWERARRAAEEIVDPETQRAARAAIDAFKVATARRAFVGDEDDMEKTEALARGADVVPALRAYGFVLAADLAARRGLRERSAALLEEAFAQASQTESGTFARDAAAMMTASAAARLESPRAWDALAAAVASLNEDEKFTGGPVRFTLETRADFGPGVADALDYALGQYDLEELFEAAAQKNFDRAVAEARNLKSPSARAQALLWAARAELVKARLAPAYLRPVH